MIIALNTQKLDLSQSTIEIHLLLLQGFQRSISIISVLFSNEIKDRRNGKQMFFHLTLQQNKINAY